MKRRAIIAAAAFAVASGAPALADWGGVAVNQAANTYGYSAGWGTRNEADQRSMFYCRQFSEGVDGCEIVLTTTTCGGVARGYVNFAARLFVSGAETRTTAADRAMAECRETAGSSCNLVRSFCADDL